MLQEAIPSLVRSDGSVLPLADIEALAIHYALATSGTRSDAARALGIGRSTLYRKMEENERLKVLDTLATSTPLEDHKPKSISPRTVVGLVRSMQSETLETIQWVVEVRFGQRRTLGEIAEILFH